MEVTINVGGFAQYLLGLGLSGDDSATVIGDSRIAYLSEKDPGHVFLPAAIWHDAAYAAGASIQGLDGMTRWQVDQEFLNKMLDIARRNYELQLQACELYLLVRKYGVGLWEGPQ